MHFVGRADWAFADYPNPSSADTHGLARSIVVGHAQGAIHTELVLSQLAPGGWLNHHIHSYEESLFVLSGELLADIDGQARRLQPGDFGLHPLGVTHAVANTGKHPARWLSVNTPQRLAPEGDWKDTFFSKEPFDLAALAARADMPTSPSPVPRNVGYRQHDGATTDGKISITMLVDGAFGAHLLTMATVDYGVGAAARAHDHPYEKGYFILDGDVGAELDGQPYGLHSGDFVFAGIGSVHSFRNEGPGRARWIETQAPQPPARHGFRWVDGWKAIEANAR
jgi:quercetin dioxygenase-like cupin family protein